jgi:tetratricopeptide (TPR) repeat protein
LEAAVEQLSVASQLIDEPAQKAALLSDLGSVYSELAARLPEDKQLDRAQHFVSANRRFTESLEIDPNYAPSWREWAVSLYRQERYSEAWIKAMRATELKAEPFPANFLNDLRKKNPELK